MLVLKSHNWSTRRSRASSSGAGVDSYSVRNSPRIRPRHRGRRRPALGRRTFHFRGVGPWGTTASVSGRGLSLQGLENPGRPVSRSASTLGWRARRKQAKARATFVVRSWRRATSHSAILIAPATRTGWVDPVALCHWSALRRRPTIAAVLPASGVQFIADTGQGPGLGQALVTAIVAWWKTPEGDHGPSSLLYGSRWGAGQVRRPSTVGRRPEVGRRSLWQEPPNSSRCGETW